MNLSGIVRQAEVVSVDVGTYTTLVIRNRDLAQAARPGQFVHIQCGEHQLRRPISIGGVTEDTLTLILEVKGKGTRWLAERRPGDVLDLLGPLGTGFPEIGGKVLLVGGGVGVPPMFSAAQKLENCDALLAFRSADRMLLEEEFRPLCGTVTVMTDDGSYGAKGFAAQGVQALLSQEHYAAVFACGPKIMLKTVTAACQAAGVPVYVSLEERMGCGIGACLGCSIPLEGPEGRHMARVCADGPVFHGEEVVWDA